MDDLPNTPDGLAEDEAALREGAAEMVVTLQTAVDRVGALARDLAVSVASVDAFRATLNANALAAGRPLVPDVLDGAVTATGGSLGPLLAAMRRGPAAAASALGKSARKPAVIPAPEPDLLPPAGFEPEAVDGAATVAVGLLSALHHDVRELGAHELVGDADPLALAMLLAEMVLELAAVATPDVGGWLAALAAENAATGG